MNNIIKNNNKQQKFYIPFKSLKEVEFNFFFKLSLLSSFDGENRTYNSIKFKSIKELGERVGVPQSTLKRYLNSLEKEGFITKEKKEIIINNNVKEMLKFIVLERETVNSLLKEDNEKLTKLYIIHKYYIGCFKGSHSKTKDSIVEEMGLSSKSKRELDNITNLNKRLVELGLISMEHYRNENGNIQIKYTLGRTKEEEQKKEPIEKESGVLPQIDNGFKF